MNKATKQIEVVKSVTVKQDVSVFEFSREEAMILRDIMGGMDESSASNILVESANHTKQTPKSLDKFCRKLAIELNRALF